MGLFDSIFGSKPKASTTTHSTLSPEQQEIMRQLATFFGGANPSNEFQAFNGSFTAGPTNIENTSLAALEQRAMQQGDQNIQNQTLNQATQLLSTMFGSGGPNSADRFRGNVGDIGTQDFSDAFQKGVVAPLTEQFMEQIIPGITRRAAGTGNLFSSDRQRTEDRALGELSEALAGVGAEYAYKASESAADRRLNAAQLESQFAGQDVGQLLDSLGLSSTLATTGAGLESQDIADLINIMDAGSLTRDLEQNEINAQYQEFLREQGFDDNMIRLMLAFLGTPTVENISTVTPGSSGLLGTAAQGLGAYFGAAASDKRLKKNITLLGHIANIPIYSWDWIKSSIKYPTIGVIAQEVMQTHPDAVTTDSDGYLMVDYTKIEV